MKASARILVALAVIAALAAVFLKTTEVRPIPSVSGSAAPVAGTQAPLPAATPVVEREQTTREAPAQAPSELPLLSGAPAIDAINELAATYDAASVPALARYLKHGDSQIRSAARDGLINLGERAAIPFLEAAAKTAGNEEAKELHDAAEFLALPTWTERRAARRQAKEAAAPNAR